jgi:propionyl-CoA synthetase
MGRTDDVINVAGHRLSTGSMEAVLAAHPAVAECAVIGVHDSLKGQLPMGLVVLKAGVGHRRGTLRDELVAAVRRDIGPVAAFRDVAVVPGCRRPARARSCAGPCAASPRVATKPVPSTIEDAGVLDTLRPLLRRGRTDEA